MNIITKIVHICKSNVNDLFLTPSQTRTKITGANTNKKVPGNKSWNFLLSVDNFGGPSQGKLELYF